MLDDAKPHWMRDHEEADQRNFDDINAALRRIEDKLTPIAEMYTTAGTLWKWVMAFSVLVSVIIGIIVGITKLTGK